MLRSCDSRCASSADNLRAAEVVTADGDRPRARRAAGRCGRRRPARDVLDYGLMPRAGAARVRVWPTCATRCASTGVRADVDELTTIASLRRAPPPPAAAHGTPVLIIGACYAGPLEQGERVLRALRAHGRPLARRHRGTSLRRAAGDERRHRAPRWHYHWRSRELAELSDAAIDTLIAATAGLTSPRSYCILLHLGGGAVARGPRPRRLRPPPARARGQHQRRQARRRSAARAPRALDARRLGGARARRHGRRVPELSRPRVPGPRAPRLRPGTYERLVAVKRDYDPTNAFHHNHNIAP